jgi:hypothetical protein
MNRRDALAATAALMGSAIIGSQAFLSGCTGKELKLEGFSPEVLSLLDEIGETMLPASASSPGAKEARIGEFMKVMVTDCYSPDEQKKFFDGITTVQQVARKNYDADFVSLNAEQKTSLMLAFDQEARKVENGDDGSAHFFTMLHQLTVWGFFSSEPGATKALRFVPIPGRYDGCVPYVKGDGAWIY